MDWYPLKLRTPARAHVFGGTAAADRLGRDRLPPGRVAETVAETWEVSDVDGDIASVVDGPLEGRSVRDLALQHPAAGAWAERLGQARTLLLPAALGAITLEGPADILVSYPPDLRRDVVAPLERAGYGPAVIAGLGDVRAG